jgi:hypothetical protein
MQRGDVLGRVSSTWIDQPCPPRPPVTLAISSADPGCLSLILNFFPSQIQRHKRGGEEKISCLTFFVAINFLLIVLLLKRYREKT